MKSSNPKLMLFIPLPFLLYLVLQDTITTGRYHPCGKLKAETSIFLHSGGHLPLNSVDPGFYEKTPGESLGHLKSGPSNPLTGYEISLHMTSGTIDEK